MQMSVRHSNRDDLLRLNISNSQCTVKVNGLNYDTFSVGPLVCYGQVVTCPGFAGFCSEAHPGDICNVVCAFGRPNVPECQPDGTWTDVPRCIEHDPGAPTQKPGTCPGIPGYCSNDVQGGLCEFDCITGPDIRSFCTADGTWEPYPTCEGDIRDLKDGCDPCPGEFGGDRPDRRSLLSNATRARLEPPQPVAFPVQARPQQQPRPQHRRPRPPSADPRRQRPQPQAPRRQQQQQRPQVIQPARQTPFVSQARPRQPSQPALRPRQPVQPLPQRPRQQQRPIQQVALPLPPAPRRETFRKTSSNRNGSNNGNALSRCPGGSLEVCIDVCPSFTARIFGACVAGCARRCPDARKKK